ncbi:MAG: hypothetical protein JWO08_2348 [Verrucomicrobiaceae bacterium]|nr:hypothetical protein [Verrucomicrobiaceae bacterium]
MHRLILTTEASTVPGLSGMQTRGYLELDGSKVASTQGVHAADVNHWLRVLDSAAVQLRLRQVPVLTPELEPAPQA